MVGMPFAWIVCWALPELIWALCCKREIYGASQFRINNEDSRYNKNGNDSPWLVYILSEFNLCNNLLTGCGKLIYRVGPFYWNHSECGNCQELSGAPQLQIGLFWDCLSCNIILAVVKNWISYNFCFLTFFWILSNARVTEGSNFVNRCFPPINC